MKTNSLLLVFLGGGLGALLRYLIEISLASSTDNSHLISLYIVNLLGAALLGYINTKKSEQTRIFWGAGFSGGFTTMSAVAMLMIDLEFNTALIHFAVMFTLGAVLYYLSNRFLGPTK